jgi:3' terminal RNA ribose 2'-O-methyltransferase Hen1
MARPVPEQGSYPVRAMLLEISTTHDPPGDLGYLLHKHPGRVQTFKLAFGEAHVFYPEASDGRCAVALLIEVDPVGLVRGKGRARTMDQYVNDRPYVASSMLAVAIAQVFGTALAGNCKDRPELVKTPIPLKARIASIPCRGGEELLKRLFEPLGYRLSIVARLLDERFPEWGASSLFTVTLEGIKTLSDLLSHLYVLIPVLDNEKHYWVGDDEVAKLLRHGEGWLAAHPEREIIATRYLKYRRNLASDALQQLREQDGEGPEVIELDSPVDPREEAAELRLSLHQQRHGTVLSVLQAKGAKRVIDLGCGEGKLVRELLGHRGFERVVGMDVSHRALDIAADRLRLDQIPPTVRQRIELFHGSLMYRDKRLEGFDAAVLCEVIEHMDEPRLSAMERVVFEFARPGIVILTTPNREYNVMWEELPPGAMRHRDHRFEWTRGQFRAWAAGVCSRFGYRCEFRGVGEAGVTPGGEAVGTPTQMGVFTRGD